MFKKKKKKKKKKKRLYNHLKNSQPINKFIIYNHFYEFMNDKNFLYIFFINNIVFY